MSVINLFPRFVCKNCIVRQNFEIVGNLVRKTHKYTHVSSGKPYNRLNAVYRDLHGAIEDTTNARDFIYALKQSERTLLLSELTVFEKERIRLEGGSEHTAPTARQLKLVALHNSLPFIGFGFLDNFLMIMAGEYIDATFGAMFGITTMAAAALGNWISDLAGVGTAHYVEVLCSKFGVRAPPLTPEQVDMSRTRWSANIGKALGISIGCIIGMFPLLFIDYRKDGSKDGSNKEKQEKT